ncbi:hypothetical protein CKO28_00195 [Rhodovibrio sodomensis]|uniref:Methyltransferase domain-containing protein n=1 Tax=Rhodovibrio sodomensis TaxID=1088 RepID=A0ABS1D7Q9_9PROT|nr:class I SAM-dependent methyltransferase [Rhodovibrio sodomensis]MBK1666459.1 hypothetical protein [Rhodovibrio sodomensis]
MRYNVIDPESYFEATAFLDMGTVLSGFERNLPAGARDLLDAGCGSGRDARVLIDRGYRVTAFDAHHELCRLASERLGVPAICKTFEQVDWHEQFDGIWACASLLHLTPAALTDAVHRLARALRVRGVIQMSFKEGDGPRIDRLGRYMHDQSWLSLKHLLCGCPDLELVRIFNTGDRMPGRDTTWINAVARRV